MMEHTARAFDADLQELARNIGAMGGLVQKQVRDAIEALLKRDVALASRVRVTDDQIDAMQRDIEEKAIVTIARRQPMAVDLREIVGALRISNDLERIGDLAESIAKHVAVLTDEFLVNEVVLQLNRNGVCGRRRARASRSRGQARARCCLLRPFVAVGSRATHSTGSAPRACWSGSGSCGFRGRHATGQNGRGALEPDLSRDGVGGKLGLHGLEQVAVEDRLMLTVIDFTPVDDLADVEPAAWISSINPSVKSLPTTLWAALPFRLGASSMAQSSRCEAADKMTSWVSVSFIGILRSVSDGVSRRHHRSPALATKPAGQDSGTRPCRLVEPSHTTALLAPKCQSFLDNLIAGFQPS
jgi:hypothetical protein